MKYSPGLPQHNDNISHEHPLKEFFVLVAGTIIIAVTVFFILGLLVDFAIRYIDPQVEVALFGMAGDQDAGALSERELELQALLNQLGSCAATDYPVTVRITESDEMNAFAMPGGRVVVLSGLLDNMSTENGVAFVLAHELGHFKNRDHLRSMGRSLVLLAISVMVTGADSNASAFLTPVYGVETAQFSQERENAADAAALQILNCHYGHVGGATEFFEQMAAANQGVDWSLTHYFASHPEARERIDNLHALAMAEGYEVRDVRN